MGWLSRGTYLALACAVGLVVVVGVILGLLKQDELQRQEEKIVQEQEMKKLKDAADNVAKQLQDVHKQNGELRGLVEGLPQNVGVPHVGGKFTVETAQAIAKAKTDGFLARIQEVNGIIAKLEKEAVGWAPRQKDILAGDAGKRVAGNKGHVEQIATLLEKDRLSAETAQAWSKQVKTLQEPVDLAIRAEDKYFAPADALVQALETLAREAQSRLAEYERDGKVLDSIVAESANNPPGMKSLQQAILELGAEQEQRRLAVIAAAKQAALDEVAKKLAEVEAKGARELGEIKLKQAVELNNAEKQQLDVAIAKLKTDREKKLLDARFESALPEIKRHLAVFIANGYAQPAGPRRLEVTGKSEPMSYSRLTGAGVLNEGKNGLEALVDIGSNFHNDRFKKNFPSQGFWTVKDVPFLQRAQDLLKEFGPIMVEKGLLAP